MKEQRFSELFSLYMENSSSESEEAELMQLLVDPELRIERDRLLEEWMARTLEGEEMTKEMADRIRRNILKDENAGVNIIGNKRAPYFDKDGHQVRGNNQGAEIENQGILTAGKDQAAEDADTPVPVKRWIPIRRVWWAAAVIFLSLGIYFLVSIHQKSVVSAPIAEISNDLPPGGYKASLKLGDGSVLILNNVKNGVIVYKGNAVANKINNEEIAYNTLSEKPTLEFNTLSTPRSGQYRIVLPDGSKVWLNAASSIRFPTVFTGNKRNVTVTGEAYFEVTHNIKNPFVVTIPLAINRQPPTVNNSANAQPITVEVLGTHFNINSYADEPDQQISLLEGSVKVQNGGSEMKLAPGQQAEIGEDQKMILHSGVDTDGIIAWKNGDFNFQNTDIQTLMRQISRWYNAEVVFEDSISKQKFSGVISRNSTLKEVLKIMEAAGIKFRIEGKKIIVKS